MTIGLESAAPPAAPPHPHRRRLLVLVALAQFMVLLDTTAVNLALPRIRTDLGMGVGGSQWVLTGYVLCFGGLMLPGGRLADRWGRRATFLTGALVFAAASLACGFAPGTGWLVAARAVQGCGAALLSPAAMSIVTTSFPAGRERTAALGVWAALAGLGGTAGVVLGGLITDRLDWRWVFHVNLPVCAVAAAGVWLLLADRPPAPARGGGRADLPGALTATLGVALLVYAVVGVGTAGAASARAAVPGAAAVLLLVSFVLVERRAADPLVPLGLFAKRSLSAAGVGRVLTSGVQAAALFLLSYYVQGSLGYSALRAGFAFLPLGLAAVAVTPPVTRLLRTAGPRAVYLTGAVLTLGALLWLTGLPRDGAYATDLLPALLALGAALQCCTLPVNVHGVSEVPERQQGIASGLLTACFQVGASLGLAVVATGAAGRTGDRVADGVPWADAWLDGLRLGFWIAAVLAALNVLNAAIGFRSPGRDTAPDTHSHGRTD
ncbi:MFS transporter [Streptomyces sp. SID8352]|uniref:MFS transporter n=1 Tax=Streptomyces sp. SID8352 TaxID=2690338 RepID=UPI001371A55A|nr:MFS transporter [Streptomyces sp. SID8352]MYU20819.1 MFS transporter [Streptomyces sp. SID8352]